MTPTLEGSAQKCLYFTEGDVLIPIVSKYGLSLELIISMSCRARGVNSAVRYGSEWWPYALGPCKMELWGATECVRAALISAAAR